MRPLLLSELAAWTGGRALGDAQVSSVTIDSRAINAGALFIALRGERVDGHDFVAVAAERGASAALVERAQPTVDLPQLVVADAVQALAQIAAGLRREQRATVLALTGSNGKTTVKTLLQGILQRMGPTWANAGNRNNEIGMPLALIDAPADSRFAIYEMGAGQPGDIAHLAAIAAPQVALVNNIGPAHLERMGSLLGIAQTKGAIYDALPADDAFGAWFAQRAGARRVLRFGLDADADLRAAEIRCSAGGSQFRLLAPQGDVAVTLALPGRHNLRNALAAAAMALAVEVPLAAIAEGLARAETVAGRQTRLRLANGAELIDDSYNANPASVAAAIASLAQAGGEAWLVLGDMLELGPQAEALHAAVGRQAREAGLGGLFTVGRLAAAATRGFGSGGEHFDDQQALVAALRPRLRSGVVCLVKGSRGSRMERVVAALADRRAEEVENAA
jgi:UDP-N-acetylmuramoyl-tripeptide--D-alanyl-D-alanine ligase